MVATEVADGVAVLAVLVDFLDELLVPVVDACGLVVGVPLAVAMKARHTVRRIDRDFMIGDWGGEKKGRLEIVVIVIVMVEFGAAGLGA